jgi:hypothetical protein
MALIEIDPRSLPLARGGRSNVACYFCSSPSGDRQICDSPECHDKAGAILRAGLDYHAAMWAAPSTGHDGIEQRSRAAVKVATFAALDLLSALILQVAMPPLMNFF